MSAAGRVVLVLGGARSGKSQLAEERGRSAAAAGCAVTVIATAHAGDDEMRARIDRHRAERPAGWTTREVPLGLGAAVAAADRVGGLLIVDCLTLWLSNCLAPASGHAPSDPDATWVAERAALLDALARPAGEIVLIGNEIGLGVVPMDALSRRFVDENGWLHQAVARRADEVIQVVAGCARWFKGQDARATGMPAPDRR